MATRAERLTAEADRLAGLLAAAPAIAGVPLAPPAYLADARLKAALQVWVDQVPLLSERGLIEDVDRTAFALYCVYVAEFVTASEDILLHGYSRAVKTISGDKMLRENPSVARRDVAARMVLDLSRRFGLTPLDRAAVLRTRKGLDLAPGLFDAPPAPEPAAAAVDPDAQAWANLLDAPTPRPN
jgi:phage terminase small subunit